MILGTEVVSDHGIPRKNFNQNKLSAPVHSFQKFCSEQEQFFLTKLVLDQNFHQTKISLTGFTIDRAQAEAVLVRILYKHKKKILKYHCVWHKYFRDR